VSRSEVSRARPGRVWSGLAGSGRVWPGRVWPGFGLAGSGRVGGEPACLVRAGLTGPVRRRLPRSSDALVCVWLRMSGRSWRIRALQTPAIATRSGSQRRSLARGRLRPEGPSGGPRMRCPGWRCARCPVWDVTVAASSLGQVQQMADNDRGGNAGDARSRDRAAQFVLVQLAWVQLAWVQLAWVQLAWVQLAWPGKGRSSRSAQLSRPDRIAPARWPPTRAGRDRLARSL
jgi:hypothetical protein